MAGSRQTVKDIRERMQELYVYDLYGFRSETKALAAILYPYETINSFAVGMHEGRRKMLVVTYYRLLVIFSRIGAPPEILSFDREEIKHPRFEKRFFTSTISFEAHGERHEFSMVSRRVLELFVWAVEQPAPIRN